MLVPLNIHVHVPTENHVLYKNIVVTEENRDTYYYPQNTWFKAGYGCNNTMYKFEPCLMFA